ncbi:hypothetical protein EDC90_101510 [Martelella mediterranea]|uniref:Uncharacterized protein n=1 Tax=Martelella mediterranea TaxID=293089 RepID=A0A4R3P013_9HYPH|nr:hypothetical protein EDC90_101510 [Martelella mediterranea]
MLAGRATDTEHSKCKVSFLPHFAATLVSKGSKTGAGVWPVENAEKGDAAQSRRQA